MKRIFFVIFLTMQYLVSRDTDIRLRIADKRRINNSGNCFLFQKCTRLMFENIFK